MIDELEKIALTLAQSDFPQKITFEVTANCNLACAMCHRPSMLRPVGVMSREIWQSCAMEIAERSPDTQCWFSGSGEPLLEPGLLLDMIAFGRSAGLRALHLNTNGMLMSAELAEALLTSGVHVVVFGVDGYTRSIYERVRVGGDRDVVYSNIEYMLKKRAEMGDGPEIHVQFIEMKENGHELDDFREYWLERGAVVKIRRKLSWGGRIRTPVQISDEDRIPCPWAMTLMHVLWDGRVPRCAGDVEGADSVGSAGEETLTELWARLRDHRQLHLDRRFDQVSDQCKECKDWMTGAAVRFRGVKNRGLHG